MPPLLFPSRSTLIVARLALLYVASFWGLSWLAFRYLYAWGMSGMSVGISIALVATAIAAFFAREFLLSEWRVTPKRQLWLIMLCAAFSNLGFTWGMLHGEVMRVMLLFYLMPVWTGLLATLVFRERTNWAGWTGIALGLLGAMVMLYEPRLGLPVPANAAEWAGLGAGVASAVMNVNIRHVSKMRPEFQAFLFGLGAIVVGSVWLLFETGPHWPRAEYVGSALAVIVLMGALLMLSYKAYQFGLRYLTSHQAVVIFPFELVVGAVSSALIAHELMSTRAWIGGLLIASASFIANWWGVQEEQEVPHHVSSGE